MPHRRWSEDAARSDVLEEPVRKLYRSREDRMIAGICGGVGEVYNIDPTLIRLAWSFSA
jgi:phage shock protein C